MFQRYPVYRLVQIARASSLTYVAPALAGTLAVVLAIRPVEDFDVWFHLTAGRLLWNTWRWPAVNTFAYTTPDHPWIDLHWVFQLLLYGAYGLGGPNGCIALTAGLALATALMLYAAARRSVSPAAAAGLVAVALAIVGFRFNPRPELMSFALFAAYIWLLDGYPTNGRAVFVLIPLQLLWVNTQGVFAVGLGLIGCYWVGTTLAFLPVPQGWRATTGCTAAEWRRLTLVLVLAATVCLFNPYGIPGALFPLQLLGRVTGDSLFSPRIGEFRAPFESGYTTIAWCWVGFLITTGISFVVNLGRWHLGRLVAAIVFAVLSSQALRNLPFFTWIAVPAIAANLGTLRAVRGPAPVAARAARRRGRSPSDQWRGLCHALEGAVIGAVVMLIAAIVTNRYAQMLGTEHEFGSGSSDLRFPASAIAFMRDARISGRPFNCLAMGGYLAWHVFPDQRVFVDGRLEAYPETFLREYFAVLDAPEQWPSVAARYAPDYVFLYHVYSNRLPLIRYLIRHDWTLVYYDEISAILVPADQAHREMRERAERTFAVMRSRRWVETPTSSSRRPWHRLVVPITEISRLRAYATFLDYIGRSAEAADVIDQALALAPHRSDIRFLVGLVNWRGGERQRAISTWRELLRRDPAFEEARRALAEATEIMESGN